MKIIVILVFSLLVSSVTQIAHAQDVKITNKIGIGFQVVQYKSDLGLGLNMTSHYFANTKFAIRVKGNLMFHEHIKDDLSTWSPYSNMSMGLIGVSGMVGDFIRLYGEGGIVGILPSSEFSTKSYDIGRYGIFGFEFFKNSRSNYFIEVGAVGTGGRADKIIYSPKYSNGLLISAGFRTQI